MVRTVKKCSSLACFNQGVLTPQQFCITSHYVMWHTLLPSFSSIAGPLLPGGWLLLLCSLSPFSPQLPSLRLVLQPTLAGHTAAPVLPPATATQHFTSHAAGGEVEQRKTQGSGQVGLLLFISFPTISVFLLINRKLGEYAWQQWCHCCTTTMHTGQGYCKPTCLQHVCEQYLKWTL